MSEAEQEGATVVCRQCGLVIEVNANVAIMLEQLLEHTLKTHPDDHQPAIWLR